MPNDAPVAEEPLLADDQSITSWVEARHQLEQADTYWLATVNRDCRPHVVPLLAVWSNGALHFVASEESHKARNLARNATCVITTRGEGLDLVIEGHATKVREEARLRRVAEAYAAKYDWQVNVRNAAFYAVRAASEPLRPYVGCAQKRRWRQGFDAAHRKAQQRAHSPVP